MKKNIRLFNIRKAVCTMSNQLHKLGLSLSEAFKKAWCRIKKSMTIRAAWSTYFNRQQCLEFLKQFNPTDLMVTLEREPENKYDLNAIKIIVHITSIHKKTMIGYVPKGLSESLAKVLDAGIAVKAVLMGIIGGYLEKENLGALINIEV